MPIRRSPNGAHHPRPQPGRDRPEWVVAINRNDWSQSIGTGGRDHPVRAASGHLDEAAPDFVAFHRLKAFGFITVTAEDRATITEEGKQALRLAQNYDGLG